MRIIFKTLIFSVSLLISIQLFINEAYAVSLDSSFGTSGKVITTFGVNSNVSKLGLQSDGKIIVVGNASNGSNLDWVIGRYDSSGQIDNSFDIDGKLVKNFGVNDSIEDLAVQDDNRIVVGGYSQPTGNYLWSLARYNSDGLLDAAFGNNGFVTTSFSSYLSLIKGLQIQSDGKIVGVGYATIGGADDLALARYNQDGTLDSTFGTGGIVTTPIGGSNDRGISVELQPDGKIVVFGDFDAGGHDEIFLTRYNSNGSLDTSFDADGKVITQIGGHDGARELALQTDGKILVTGITINGGTQDTYVARYNPNGSLDTSFGTGGKVVNLYPGGHDGANSLLIESDGKILLGGYQETGGAGGQDFALRRFNTDGTLDNSFGTNGSFLTPIGSANDAINSISRQNDGKIIAAGTSFNGTHNDWSMARYSDLMSVTLDVLYFSQNASSPLWGPTEYDHATTKFGITGLPASMDWWGCAVTSVAMILNHHKINNFVDGTTINPGSLNEWLKKNDGYVTGYDEKGEWYSILDWSRIGSLTAQISTKSATPKTPKLEWKRLAATEENLNRELSNNKPPVIMVKNGDTKMHFVVAKGMTDNIYTINDPEWKYPDLTKFGNTFYQIDSFKPSQSNLSYLTIVINPKVEVLVTDQLGRKTGKHVENGITQTYMEIPEALYSYEEPISNPGDGGDPKSFGTGVNSFILPTPTNGNYTIALSSKEDTFYTINISTTEKDGAYGLNTFQGAVAPGNDDISDVNYSQENPSEAKKSVTFESTLKDIKELRNLKLMSYFFALGQTAVVKQAEKLHNAGKDKEAIKLINANIIVINKSPKSLIDPKAKEVLIYDLNALKVFIKN